jgi:uncharacterized membrane protein
MNSPGITTIVLRGVLVTIAAVGFINALYFTLLYFRLVHPNTRFVPAICQLDEQTCRAVVFTSYGRIWRVPNGLMGILFYLLVIASALIGRRWLVNVALATALLSLMYGLYLLYALVFRLKAQCPLCLLGHALNVLVGVLLLLLRNATE